MYQKGVIRNFFCPTYAFEDRRLICKSVLKVSQTVIPSRASVQRSFTLGVNLQTNRLNKWRGCAVAAPTDEAVAREGNPGNNEGKPSSADTARTITELVDHGTLATVCQDGIPLGTYITYVLVGGDGQPILRLRADAMHTANLLQNPRCSLFIVPSQRPARLLARVTLIGQVCASHVHELRPVSALCPQRLSVHARVLCCDSC